MDHGQAEQPNGMTADDGPVDDNQQQARTRKRGKERDDAKVPKLMGIYADDASRAQCEREREQYAEGRHRAVRRDEKRADVNENGMHLNKDIVSGQCYGFESLPPGKGIHLPGQNRWKVESGPLGRG